MPPSVGPRESLALVLLYQAGAHLEALARALGRDGRTVRKVLRQAGVPLRTDPPLPPDWRVGLPRETVAALDAYRTAVAQWHRTAWQQIDQQATQPAPGQYGFLSQVAYTALLQPPMPLECPEDVGARLGVALTRVLLVYAEGVAQAEAARH
jgi:hypothetical protein